MAIFTYNFLKCKEHKKASNAILGLKSLLLATCKCNQSDVFLEILKKAIIVMVFFFFSCNKHKEIGPQSGPFGILIGSRALKRHCGCTQLMLKG